MSLAVRYYASNRLEIDEWIERVHEISDREQAKWQAAREATAS